MQYSATRTLANCARRHFSEPVKSVLMTRKDHILFSLFGLMILAQHSQSTDDTVALWGHYVFRVDNSDTVGTAVLRA